MGSRSSGVGARAALGGICGTCKESAAWAHPPNDDERRKPTRTWARTAFTHALLRAPDTSATLHPRRRRTGDRWCASTRGKSELHRVRCRVTPGGGNAEESATENRPP